MVGFSGTKSLVQVWSASIPFCQNMDGKPVCACGSKLTRLSDRMLLVWADHEGSAVDVCLHRCWGLGMFLYGTLRLRVYTHICNGLGRFLSGTLPAHLFAFWTMDTQWTLNGHSMDTTMDTQWTLRKTICLTHAC